MANRQDKPTWDVFLSYATKDDKAFVLRLHNDLKAAGKTLWWNEEVMESRGRFFLNEIRDAIWQSERLVAVIGPKALKSVYVWQEWAYAHYFARALVPVVRIGSYEAISEESKEILWRDEFERIPDTFHDLSALHCPDFRDDALYEDSFAHLLRVLNSDLLPLAPVLGSPPKFPPPNFLPRRRAIKRLAELRLVQPRDLRAVQPENRMMVIHGSGGSGKTVAANAIAHSVQTRWAFEDGVVWLKIGKPHSEEEDLPSEALHVLRAFKALGRCFKQRVNDYSDVTIARELVTDLLADKRCLLVLDDVWDSADVQEFVNAMGPGCSMYITTRDKSIAAELSVPSVSLGGEDLQLDKQEALQLLADWAKSKPKDLPPEAAQVAEICDRLPLALAICGATIQNGFSWSRLPSALSEAKERNVEAKITAYDRATVSVFSPIAVSLDYLKELDAQDRHAGRGPIHRYDRYMDLAALPGGETTPEDVISTLWLARRDVDEDSVIHLLGKLDAWALLRMLGEDPYAVVLLHRLQSAYLQKVARENEDLEDLHREFGQALFRTWQTGKLPAGRQLDDRECSQADDYCTQFLLDHLVKGRCWDEVERLLGDPRYLELRHDGEGQILLEVEIAELLRNEGIPVRQIFEGAWEGITTKFPLGREKADWLDIFAYWVDRYGKTDDREWRSEEHRFAANRFDDACGEVSRLLSKKYVEEGKQDWAMRYAELSTWAYQRAGDFRGCKEACEEAELLCANEVLEPGYRGLGRVEFVRMRAHASEVLASKEISPECQEEYAAHADAAYEELSARFSDLSARGWRLNKQEWRELGPSEQRLSEGFQVHLRRRSKESREFQAVVVSNEHDALGAMYVIQSLEALGGEVDWLHHSQFNTDHSSLVDCAMVVLIGGPKAPGISQVADRFYRTDREGFLRMYSGLHFGATTLRTVISGVPYYMLGGVSKMHTLLAAWQFAERQYLHDIETRF